MFRKTHHTAVIASTALALALAVPAAAAQNTPAQSPTRQTAESRSGGRYDEQIRQELQKKFQGKDDYKSVQYKVEDGVVNLQGTVELYAHKQKADDRAHDVDHVQSVSNQIQVAGPTVSDAQLQEKLANKLRYDRIGQGIMFNNLKLGVRNGVVEIAGNVHDEADRASALAIAAHMPGVKDVRDEIQVAPVSGFDDDLRVNIARAIYGDPTFTMYANDPQAPIRIVVDRGHVTLEGVVNSQVDKQLAQSKAASVPGSFSITNNLVVAGRETAEK
jgi:hyperosmotically inducible periplasmic protein